MASPKTNGQLVTDAITLANSFEWVLHNDVLYAPMDYETGDWSVIPPANRKCWIPMSSREIQRMARDQFDTLFVKNQLSEFIGMLKQEAQQIDTVDPRLLIKTPDGLKALEVDGTLTDPDGHFVPNMLVPTLNQDPDDKAEIQSVVLDWLGDEQEVATSLLHHLATALAPHWSAGKYVLLIGDGRNGKSVLMTMLKHLFGPHNCSGVERQVISEGSPGTFDLINKMLNLVFDGPAEFVKDSGREKSIITGESINVRKLYANEMTVVQTNALFVEGLNQEPKSRDKSSALQARLVRFYFPNRYPENDMFFEHMLSERMLGALLAVLLDHYVTQSQKGTLLALTDASRRLQLEHMEDNSLGFQFLAHLEETEPLGAEEVLVDQPFDDLVQRFQSWRLKVNDLTVYDKQTVHHMFRPVLNTQRRSARIAHKSTPTKIRFVTSLKQEAMEFLSTLKEDTDATAVVDAGHV